MKSKSISTEAMAVLSECEVKDSTVNIPGGLNNPLPRKLYEEVNLVLMGIGGKWNKKAKAHVFEESHEKVCEMLEGCIQTGLAVPLHRNGYFPTPATLADIAVKLAGLRDDDVILEPSAGTGALVEAIRRDIIPGELLAIEIDQKNFNVLANRYFESRWFTGFCKDFLKHFAINKFDKVVMNPPFGNINGQSLGDISHIMHAWGMLKPGGRLVSIASSSLTFRREKKAVEFRELVARHGRLEEVPDKAFKESGTLVKTVIVVLDKPE